MATIGLDKRYYAEITEGDAGEETYGTPKRAEKQCHLQRDEAEDPE